MTPTPGGFWLIDFFDRFFEKMDNIFFLFKSMFESIGLLDNLWVFFPNFLFPIVSCMLAVAVIMWVVNLF